MPKHREMHVLTATDMLTNNSPPARSTVVVIDQAPPRRHPITYALQTAVLAIFSALLMTIGASGWLVLRNLSAGTGGLRIRLNWTAIVALGVPFVALAFLLVWLFVWVAVRQNPRDKPQLKPARSERITRVVS